MKIRLALIDNDEDYRKRLSDFYIKNYQDRIEILTFSSLDSFEQNRGNKTIDVMLVSESIEDDLLSYSKKSSIAYLADRNLIERKNNIRVINKFKKPEQIYKEILNILAESSNGDVAYKFSEGKGTIVEVFMPVSGGAGATSLSISYAKRLAMKGISTLYLNFEVLNSSKIYLSGEGSGFDEIIYAIKSKKQNVALKIESNVISSKEGVNFFNEPRSALDMLELSDEDIELLINESQNMGKYKHIVIDSTLCLNSRLKLFSKIAHRVILIAEPNDIGIKKLNDLNDALALMEEGGAIDITNKITIVCNKATDNSQTLPDNLPYREYIKRYNIGEGDITEVLMQVPLLEKLG